MPVGNGGGAENGENSRENGGMKLEKMDIILVILVKIITIQMLQGLVLEIQRSMILIWTYPTQCHLQSRGCIDLSLQMCCLLQPGCKVALSHETLGFIHAACTIQAHALRLG